MPEQIAFETERLAVHRIGPNDYDAMMEVYGDVELMQYVGDGSPITPEDCKRWIDITIDNYQKRGYGLFIVMSKEELGLIGFLGITHPNSQPEAEIKYVIKQSRWRQGFAQELIAGACKFAETKLRLNELIATVHPDNLASLHILAKVGFVRQPDIQHDDGSMTVLWKYSINP